MYEKKYKKDLLPKCLYEDERGLPYYRLTWNQIRTIIEEEKEIVAKHFINQLKKITSSREDSLIDSWDKLQCLYKTEKRKWKID